MRPSGEILVPYYERRARRSWTIEYQTPPGGDARSLPAGSVCDLWVRPIEGARPSGWGMIAGYASPEEFIIQALEKELAKLEVRSGTGSSIPNSARIEAERSCSLGAVLFKARLVRRIPGTVS